LRIGLLSDVHGNLPGLEAAWRALAEYAPDMTVCLGDLVQYGPFPGPVVSFVRSHGIETVQGNCDRAVGRRRRDCGDVFENPHWRKLAGEYLEWTSDNLSSDEAVFLRNLPDELRFVIDRQPVLFVHGLPGRPSEGLPGATAHEVYDLLLERNGCGVFACGHTHEHMVVRRPGGVLVNPGSVGAGSSPCGGTFAVVDTAQGAETSVDIVEFTYDIRALKAAYEENGLPELFFHCSRLGRDPRGKWHTEDPYFRQEWATLPPQ
jgi:putative phosphoesterase